MDIEDIIELEKRLQENIWIKIDKNHKVWEKLREELRPEITRDPRELGSILTEPVSGNKVQTRRSSAFGKDSSNSAKNPVDSSLRSELGITGSCIPKNLEKSVIKNEVE